MDFFQWKKYFCRKNIFLIFKIIFFDEKIKVEKKMDHHFDVKFCQESISDGFRTLWALYNTLNSILEKKIPFFCSNCHRRTLRAFSFVDPLYRPFSRITSFLAALHCFLAALHVFYSKCSQNAQFSSFRKNGITCRITWNAMQENDGACNQA